MKNSYQVGYLCGYMQKRAQADIVPGWRENLGDFYGADSIPSWSDIKGSLRRASGLGAEGDTFKHEPPIAPGAVTRAKREVGAGTFGMTPREAKKRKKQREQPVKPGKAFWAAPTAAEQLQAELASGGGRKVRAGRTAARAEREAFERGGSEASKAIIAKQKADFAEGGNTLSNLMDLLRNRNVQYGLAAGGGAALGAGAGAMLAGKKRRGRGALIGGAAGAAMTPLALHLARKQGLVS